jgi:hypothetical protein
MNLLLLSRFDPSLTQIRSAGQILQAIWLD